MAQSKPLTIKDFLLLSILHHAGCETSIRSFQDLENDPKALEVYQSKKTIRRRVYRFWRRDPNGKLITPENSCLGKMTPNKIQLWGATLWDFYTTHRTPSIPNLRTVTTRSKLLKWMTMQGETDHAIDGMISAANEEDPREILPFPISEVIEAQEMNIRLGIYGISKSIDKDQRSDEAQGVFCPESYPAPWPLLPFSYEPAPLEHHIPLCQLPSTLVVHDPWDLLSVTKDADEYSNKEYDWASSEDRTYLYKLYVSKKGEDRNEEGSKAEKEEKTRRRLKALEDLHIDDPDILSDNLDAMLLVPSSVKPGPSEPPILVLYEAAPDPKPADIAHLYLSPAELIGEGHHSLVANAEWEIPRSLIVPDILCYECILEDVHQSLLALDGADGSMKDEKWKAKSGVWQKHQVSRPAEVFKVAFESEELEPIASYVRSGNLETEYKYVGPCRPIKTNVKRQNGENYCAHISKRLHIDEGTRAHPLTAKVSVVAKLSKEDDDHLSHESDIYEEFPRHFFQHWNGYNVVVPLDKPTPVGAVVPQYYGYYEPQEDTSRNQYLSPIMLLEECGRQVVVDDLNMDDRNECASLFFRLHHQGYIHDSVYPRNVLCQEGPLDRPMYQRGTGDFTEDGRKHTFRLIDFGRTQGYKNPYQRSHEEAIVEKMTKYYLSLQSQKTSDPSNVLEDSESSHPQGTGTSALQWPLAPPDEDYTSVLATISLPLPHELVERILLLLDTKSTLKCRLANREFNAIIQSSTLVQYYLACKAAGVIDNPQSPLSYAERLEALKKREDAWRKLKPVFETTIKANDQPSTSYELTAGNYFLCDDKWKDLHYCHLPSSPQDNPQWFRIPGHGPGPGWSGSIIDMGMAVYEHDLVVSVISSEVGNQADMQPGHSLDLVLLKFSTGEYHPLARRPLIHVQRSPSAQPYTTVRIVGNNLALVVDDLDGSKLFIFDWRTGHKRLQHEAIEDAYEYSIPVFVTPELLLVPNCNLSHFEVWHLFPSHPNSNCPVQILSLQIPAVSDNYSVIGIYCHGELIPFLHSMPYLPPRPFFPSSEDSIIVIKLLLESFSAFHRSAYNLIMHRRALLDMIQKWTSPSLLEQGLPTWLTNEVTVHQVADPDDRYVRLAAQSEFVSTMLHPGSSQPRDSSPTSHMSTDSSSSSGSASSTSRYNIPQVQWANWGPPISRLFQANETRAWIIQSIGQRYVFLNPSPLDKRKCMICVADFNLHNVRRNAEMMAQLRGEGEDNGSNDNNSGEGKKERIEEELKILDHKGVFSEEVHMGLKCVVYHAPGEYDFDAVLMDEERLLGLKLGVNREKSIKVLYFG